MPQYLPTLLHRRSRPIPRRGWKRAARGLSAACVTLLLFIVVWPAADHHFAERAYAPDHAHPVAHQIEPERLLLSPPGYEPLLPQLPHVHIRGVSISDLLQRQLLPDASLNWEPEGAMGFVRLLMPMMSAPLPPDPPIALLGHVAQSPVVPLFGIVVAPLHPPPISAL